MNNCEINQGNPSPVPSETFCDRLEFVSLRDPRQTLDGYSRLQRKNIENL